MTLRFVPSTNQIKLPECGRQKDEMKCMTEVKKYRDKARKSHVHATRIPAKEAGAGRKKMNVNGWLFFQD